MQRRARAVSTASTSIRGNMFQTRAAVPQQTPARTGNSLWPTGPHRQTCVPGAMALSPTNSAQSLGAAAVALAAATASRSVLTPVSRSLLSERSIRSKARGADAGATFSVGRAEGNEKVGCCGSSACEMAFAPAAVICPPLRLSCRAREGSLAARAAAVASSGVRFIGGCRAAGCWGLAGLNRSPSPVARRRCRRGRSFVDKPEPAAQLTWPTSSCPA